MAFARILLGWAAVLALFLGWRLVERQLRGSAEPLAADLRLVLPSLAIEAALLTLFAGLWFASLGHGGAVLLFLLVGGLMEVPRLRYQPVTAGNWKPMVGGILRIVLGGLVLGFLLA